MATHTPAPWTLDSRTLRVLTGDTDEFDKRRVIALVNVGLIYGGQGDANAHLIKQAPRLLNAARQVLDATPGSEEEQEARAHLRAVVEAATGEGSTDVSRGVSTRQNVRISQ